MKQKLLEHQQPSMASPASSIFLSAVRLLFFVIASDGRTLLQAHAPSNDDPFLDSNSSSTTNEYDAAGLMVLIDQFPQLSGAQFPPYTNDPCYPHMLPWISCNDDSIRRITALYLQYKNLDGDLPNFIIMDALETIELQGNNLSGSIPSFLGFLPNLTHLNLAFNNFSGELPYSLVNNNLITLNTTGNVGLYSPNITYSPPFLPNITTNLPPLVPPKTHKKSNNPSTKDILSAVLPMVIIPLIGLLCGCLRRKKNAAGTDTT